MEIEIDDKIYNVLDERSGEKGFDETEEYIEYLLKQVVEKIRKESRDSSDYDKEEKEEVKNRLRDLGYTG